MRERLSRADLRFLAICFGLLVVTIWFSAHYFYRAFPEASIDFRVTRAEARELARRFLAGRGYSLAGHREASQFQYDETAKTFLERELGLERANAIMGTRVRLWRWAQRWFRPLEREEYRAEITPRGEVAGFAHVIPEAAARPSLNADQARALAENFLRTDLHRDPADLEFVESSSVARPARTDFVFAWKTRDFDLRDATYRMEITVAGDEIAAYREYLKIPDKWLRDYERLRSRNLTAQTVDTGLLVMLAVGLLVTLVLAIRSHDVRWGTAATVGAIGAVLSFLASWNGQPQAEFNYPTTDSYGSFLARFLLQSITSALAAGGLLFVLTAAAETAYRRRFGSKLALGPLFQGRSLRTKAFFVGSVLGLTLTGIFVAYQTAFYLLAFRFGAWSPADVPYDDLLNTRFPWLFVLLGGFLPAISEEFLFRLFAIPFLEKVLRFTWVAVILAGFVWGFGHSGYPQQPFYIRGVEVGIGGVALGWVMLRWGILPTLVWHYSVDALYTALLLLRSHNTYFVVSGAVSAGIMALPAIVAGILYLRRGGFEPETGFTNRDHMTAAPEPALEATAPIELEAAPYRPQSARARAAILALGIAGAAMLLIPVTRFGDRPEFEVSREEARVAGVRFVRSLGLAEKDYRTAVYPETQWQSEAGKYMLERRPVAYLARAWESEVPLYEWTVRFYQPLQQEELQVTLDPSSGRVMDFEHTIPEDRPGADLTPDAARLLAADFLASRGFDVDTLELKESSSEKKKARRDYTLVWEARPGDPRNLDEAKFRVRVELAGDRVVTVDRYWKVPEAFARQRMQRNALSNLLSALRVGVMIAAFVIGIRLLVQRTRKRQLQWRAAVRLAAPLAVLTLLASLADMPLAFRAYDTALPLETFFTTVLIGIGTATVGMFLGLAAAFGLLLALEPKAEAIFARGARRQFAPDAFAALVPVLGLAAAFNQLAWLLIDRFHAQAVMSADPPAVFASTIPAISALARACWQTVFALAALALVRYLWSILRRRRYLAIVLGPVALAALVSTQAHTPGEFLLQYGILLIGAFLAATWCRLAARDNPLAYVLAIWSLSLGSHALSFAMEPADAIRRQGWLLFAFWIGTLLWVAWPLIRKTHPLDPDRTLWSPELQR